VEATASSKDFDRTDVFRSGSLETRYQSYRQRDGRSVRELDPQCVLLSAVDDSGSPRLRIRCTAPGARGAREICAQLLFYPVRHQTNLQSSGMQTRLLEPNAWVIRYENIVPKFEVNKLKESL